MAPCTISKKKITGPGGGSLWPVLNQIRLTLNASFCGRFPETCYAAASNIGQMNYCGTKSIINNGRVGPSEFETWDPVCHTWVPGPGLITIHDQE